MDFINQAGIQECSIKLTAAAKQRMLNPQLFKDAECTLWRAGQLISLVKRIMRISRHNDPVYASEIFIESLPKTILDVFVSTSAKDNTTKGLGLSSEVHSASSRQELFAPILKTD